RRSRRLPRARGVTWMSWHARGERVHGTFAARRKMALGHRLHVETTMARMRVGTALLFLLAPSVAAALPGPNVQYTAGENELTITTDEGPKKQPVENCSGKSSLV